MGLGLVAGGDAGRVGRWRAARRVLAVRLDNLGDVLVTTPAIRALRAGLPDAEIVLLASPAGAQAAPLIPGLDDVVVARVPWMDPWGDLPQDPARELALVEELRARQIDAAVIFTSYRQSPHPTAYLCYMAGVPLRLAASAGGHGSLLTDSIRPIELPIHEAEHGLALVASVGFAPAEPDLALRVPEEARASIAARLGGLPPGPLAVVHPGCSMPARTYPWELFAAAADELAERLGATVAVTGAESERDLVGRVVGRMRAPAVPLAGELSFAELCALVETADVVVTNNTGPMHIAAALKTPVVALFALTNPPERWGPWRVPHRMLNHDVPCRLCYSKVCPHHQECLALVTPEMVAAAAAELLAGAGALPRRAALAGVL